MASLAAIQKQVDKLSEIVSYAGRVDVELNDDELLFLHNNLKYAPTKTGRKFHASNDFVRAVVGPVGSGKSTMCCMEIIRHVMSMPKCWDGVRRARWAVIRNTYPDLKTTTLATWKDWAQGLGSDSLRMDSPISYMSRFQASGGPCELQVLFVALDDERDVKKLQSLEISGAYINEARYIPEVILNTLKQRVGRYPSKGMLPCEFEAKIILDTNPCDTDFWFYKLFEEKKEEGHAVFHQPPGLVKVDGKYVTNSEAENLENLPKDYYVKAAQGTPDSEIRVQLCGEYGSYVDGDPVFSSYNDDVHSSDALEFTPGLPVYIGWDYGLTPAAVFAQLSPRGQLQIIKEFCSSNMFLESFLDSVVKPFINSNLSGYELISIGDPAGAIRKDTDGKTCMQMLFDHGIYTMPALSNLLTPRLGAVDKLLCRMIGGQPGIIISRHGAPSIRKGFQGKYCYKIVNGKKEPDKNEYSHPMDALQYIAMQVVGVDTNKPKNTPRAEYVPSELC